MPGHPGQKGKINVFSVRETAEVSADKPGFSEEAKVRERLFGVYMTER